MLPTICHTKFDCLPQIDYPFPNPHKKPEVVKSQSAIDKEKEEEELQLAVRMLASIKFVCERLTPV
jgi:hypothetical protein